MSASDQGNARLRPTARHPSTPSEYLPDTGRNECRSRSASLKRKRNAISDCYELGDSFSILGSDLHLPDTQLKLIPRLLIPRADLPIVYILAEVGKDGLSSPRLFSACLQALDVLSPPQRFPHEQGILIVERDDKSTLYAIEAVEYGLYVLCPLNDWVRLEDFDAQSGKARKIVHGIPTSNAATNDPWWKQAGVRFDTRQNRVPQNMIQPDIGSIRLSMKPVYPPLKVEDGVDSLLGDTILAVQPPDAEPVAPNLANKDAVVASNTDPEDVPSMIRAQYLDALYMSKTSLAYFAKGPLSRARAATVSEIPSTTLSELEDLLRGNILPISSNDRKYSDSLPTLINELPPGITTADQDSSIYGKVCRSKKRKKIGKDGLFPGEEDLVVKWWLRREDSTLIGGPNVAREERVKLGLVEQRARETQLQIIMILEVLALEAAATIGSVNSHRDVPLSRRSGESVQIHTKKSKKPLNLSTLLDVLVDRLCIWHSTSQEDSSVSENAQHGTNEKQSSSDGDRLRNFCTEVVVPFYATRLPELYPLICRKLGGPIGPPPVRALVDKASATQRATSKPGAAVRRVQSSKSRKPLERVLTDQKMGPRSLRPGLVRSSTDSALPGIKRELSDISLSAVPISRPNLQHSKRYSQREVDLTAVSQATEAKLQRKAAIEQELQGAIAALKKPNPRMAVKEFVESAERRATTGSRSKKSKNPVRIAPERGIQVMATPRNYRLKNVYPNVPRNWGSLVVEQDEPGSIPPSSDPRILSSSSKPPAIDALHASSRSCELQSQISSHSLNRPGILSTPSHRQSRLDPFSVGGVPTAQDDEDELSQDSPALPVTKAVYRSFRRPVPPGRTPSYEISATVSGESNTPSRRASGQRPLSSVTVTARRLGGTGCTRAEDTPATTIDQLRAVESSTVKCEKNSAVSTETQEQSIYQALGWDDDLDELV